MGSFLLGPLTVNEDHGTVSYSGVPVEVSESYLRVLKLWKYDHRRRITHQQIEEIFKRGDSEKHTEAKQIKWLLLKALEPLNLPKDQFDIYSSGKGAYRLRLGGDAITSGQETQVQQPTPSENKRMNRVPGSESDSAFQERIRHQSSIKTFESWIEAEPIIRSAQKSIVIIDSYFNHAMDLRRWVQKAVKSGVSALDISIYMASDETMFGAQRFIEKQRPHDANISYKQSLSKGLSARDIEAYKKGIEHWAGELEACLFGQPVSLNIYTYKTMLSIRIILVDDLHFIFGWFPLLDHNPDYICFYLKKSADLSGADIEVVEKLIKQVNVVVEIREPFPPARANAG